MNKKVGRNDPCPCGSGKKFKKCCEQRLSVKNKLKDSVITARPSGSGAFNKKTDKISANFFSQKTGNLEKSSNDLKSKVQGSSPEVDKST